MKFALILVALIVAAPAIAAAPPMLNVAAFVAKSDALKAKGVLAMFSADFKRLIGQIKADAAALRRERLAAASAGNPPAYCPPEKLKLSDKEIMAAMTAVPAGLRTRTSTHDALRGYFARRYPCRA